MRNISTSSHAEHPWSYSQSKWVLTWRQRKQLQMETKCWKYFWVHDFFTYKLGPQWYVGLLFVIYAPSPIHKSTFEAMVCPRSLAFSIWILFDFWLPKTSNFVLKKKQTIQMPEFLFVCLFSFVSMIWDMSHESSPTSQITQLKLSLSKKPTQGKRKMIEK